MIIIVWICSWPASVKDVIVLTFFAYAKIMEELAQIGIVGLVLKRQCASVVEKLAKLIWPFTQKVGRVEFHLYDLVVLLLSRSLGARPGKITKEEIDENVGKGFQVVTA